MLGREDAGPLSCRKLKNGKHLNIGQPVTTLCVDALSSLTTLSQLLTTLREEALENILGRAENAVF